MFENTLASFSSVFRKEVLIKSIPYLGLGIGILSIGGSLVSLFFVTNASATSTPDTEGICVSQTAQGEVVVYVSGAVKNPGIYSLESGKRVGDAVASAGGLIEDADQFSIQKNINFAEAVTDSSQIYFPFKQEAAKTVSKSVVENGDPANSTTGTKISINTASQSELESLPKIGEKTAAGIIAGRPFMNLKELVSKKILSQNVYDELESIIEL